MAAGKKVDKRASVKSTVNSVSEDDCDDGASNLDLIEPGLWLGNLAAATDSEVLESNRITHVLTVDSCPLPSKIVMAPGIATKFVQVTDIPKEDLLSFFEETSGFIREGLEKSAVLVHCYYGVSRSSTIVIAYLMKKYEISLDEALARAKAKRKFVCPNSGFMSQLKLYENMGWKIDKTNLQYKRYRLHMASDKINKAKILPQNCTDVVKVDPAQMTVNPEPVVYRCRRCRRIIASASHLLPHKPKETPVWFDPKWSQSLEGVELCSETYFIEPLSWMSEVPHQMQGKLYCPKCQNKLGSFSWVLGCQCPCGAKVQPAFYLVPSKVDHSSGVQNLQ